MKSQETRDRETVTIVAGVLPFLLVAAGGVLVLVMAQELVGFKGDVLDVLAWRLPQPPELAAVKGPD